MIEGKQQEGVKFADYFDYQEPLNKIPSHRALALFRGRNESVLALNIDVPEAPQGPDQHPCQQRIARHFNINDQRRGADQWLLETVRWAWRVKIAPHLDLELKQRLREQAESEAIQVFVRNLHDLLLAAPAGQRATIGLDPGLRTGVKSSGCGSHEQTAGHRYHLSTCTAKSAGMKQIHRLADLAARHNVELISIGNGTASRETDQLVAQLIKRHPELRLQKMMVSEAGASVYSASELAAQEMPTLDVSLRGAVSIARRLQDPLAELVKIEPKAIGVGQ